MTPVSLASLFLLLPLLGVLLPLAILLLARHLEAHIWRRSLVPIELTLPIGLETEAVVRWLNTVAATTHPPRLSLLFCPPIALEVVAGTNGIRHILLVPKHQRASIQAGLQATLPGIRFGEAAVNYLQIRPRCTVAVEAVLTNSQRQLSADRAEGTTTALLASLQPLSFGETVVFQWIATGAGTPAPVPSLNAKTSSSNNNPGNLAALANLPANLAGEELTDSESIRSARTKQTDALLHSLIRVGAGAANKADALALCHRVWTQLRGLNAPGVQLTLRWWLWPKWAASRLSKLATPTTRWPLLLSTRETAGLLPILVSEVPQPGLTLGVARQLPPPPEMLRLSTASTATVQIGLSNYAGIPERPLCLDAKDRLRHLYVLGPTGTGKSTLLGNLILQDIAAGYGVVVIDPKGDLVTDVLGRFPEERAADLIVLDPTATDKPIGCNVLAAGADEQHRETVVEHLTHIWHVLYKDFWGPQTEDILYNTLLTLASIKAANGEPFTLIEAEKVLVDSAFRKYVTSHPDAPDYLADFWKEHQNLKKWERSHRIAPVLNKLRKASTRTPARLLLGQSHGIDLRQVLRERKILLVPLKRGPLGEGNAAFLGAMLLEVLWQAIQERIDLPYEQRHPVFVYIDEAHYVLQLPVDIGDMLADARGFGASFTLAHQNLDQIEDVRVRNGIMSNAKSHIVFEVEEKDAATLAPSFEPYLTARDLTKLGLHGIAVRPCVNGETLAPTTGITVDLPTIFTDARVLARASRERYGRPRGEVEAAIRARGKKAEGGGRNNRGDNGTGKDKASKQPSGYGREPANPGEAQPTVRTDEAPGDRQATEAAGDNEGTTSSSNGSAASPEASS